jgi:kynurenine 3-monooxygenase
MITLIGAGLAGTLLAIELNKRGFPVEIYERRADRRKVVQDAGRSINLAVSARGIHALEQAGIWPAVQSIAVPMYGRRIHAAPSQAVSRQLSFQPYGKNPSEHINSVSRADLNVTLLNAAAERNIPIHFNHRCTDANMETGALLFHNEETNRAFTVKAETVIAADGANSAVRYPMLKQPRFNYSQHYLDYGYKELTIPAGPNGTHVMDANSLHIWPRGSYMLIALPNPDGTFGCILFLPFEGDPSFATLESAEDVEEFFEIHFADVVPLMPQLAENFAANPVASMVTIRCSPWNVGGRFLLLGDSAHAIVPFFGQGLNAAFEDCTILLDILDRIGPDWPRVFDEFSQSRCQDTDAISEMALENFIEMRDRVADPAFLFRKRAELALEARFPKFFVPKYAMVTFHRIPYSVALSRGRIQEDILATVCNGIDDLDNLDWQRAGILIARDLTPLQFKT